MEPASHVSLFITIKNLSYVLAFLGTLEYLNLGHEAVSILAFLLLVDFFTGVLRAGIVEGGKAVKSSIGIRGLLSKLLVFLIPFVIALAGKGVGVDMSALATSSLTIFILSTSYSIIGNIHSITTGHPKQEFDAIDYVYRQVGEILKRIIPEDKDPKGL